MHLRLKFIASVVVGAIIGVVAADTGTFGIKPKDGFVPTKEVAIKIAVAVWEPIFGADPIAAEKPYEARLSNGVWFVEGSLPPGSVGGVAEARISKEDGRILGVIHGQ
jgi:hypothetical protein